MIPTDLLESCDNLNKISGKTGKDVMIWAADTAGKYEQCKLKHARLAQAASAANGFALENNPK